MMRTALYPLKFRPIYQARVWGGRGLERLGRSLPGGSDQAIGESWELADVPVVSGGNATRSVVADGPLAGRTLHDLLSDLGPELIGRRDVDSDAAFPLLIKYLDARENLSVQVHPGADYVATHPGTFVKSEAWYILHAAPGAVIYNGLLPGVTREQFHAALIAGNVESLLNLIYVSAGECYYLPAGRCHALGAGVMVAEVQTTSDTTFRVYDWGRKGREMHVEQAMACIDFVGGGNTKSVPRTRTMRDALTVDVLVDCEHFHLEKISSTKYHMPLRNRGAEIWMILSGEGRLTCDDGGLDEVSLTQAETVLLPASMRNPTLHIDTEMTWLRVVLPN